MSYCRLEPGYSDVYIYNSGPGSFSMHIADRMLGDSGEPQRELLFLDQFSYGSEIEVLAGIDHLKRLVPGILVPEEATRRLQFESVHGLSGSIQENIDMTLEILKRRWEERN